MDPNVLVSLAHPRGVVATASLMVTVHMLGAYQLYRQEQRLKHMLVSFSVCLSCELIH